MNQREANPIEAAALGYAAGGWPVFPCDPTPDAPGTPATKRRAKRPLVAGADRDADGNKIPKTGGLYRASLDAGQIRAWWRRTPDALIGLPTGQASGVLVIDFDPHGETVAETEARLVEAVGSLPHGPIAETQSGGRHRYYRLPEGEAEMPRNSAKRLPNIDWRGDGGYVILPPSAMRDGKAYRWLVAPSEAEFPAAPPLLLDLVYARGVFARGEAATTGESGAMPQAPRRAVDDPGEKAVRAYSHAALDRARDDVSAAPEGRRGFTLNQVAFGIAPFVGLGLLTERQVMAALQDGADACGLTATDGAAERDAKIRRGLDANRGNTSALARRTEEIRAEAAEKAARRLSRPPPVAGPADYGLPDWNAPAGSGGGMAWGADGEPETGEDDSGGAIDPDIGEGGDDDGPPVGPIDHAAVEFCAALDQNDTDNGRRLLSHFGPEVVHVREVGWHAYAGTHWDVEGGTEAVERMAQETARRIRLEAAYIHPGRRDREIVEAAKGLDGKPDGELTEAEKGLRDAAAKALERLEKRRGDRRKFSISCGNRARTVAMIAQALPHRSIAPAEMDRDGMRFNVANGTLQFRRRIEMVEDLECPDPEVTRLVRRVRVEVSLRGHDRADLISKLAPVVYDPDARCPKWDAFLERFQPEADRRRFLQTAAGRGMIGGASTQALIFLWGDGANGKSVFTETIAQMLGAYAGRLKPESISGLTETSGDKATPDFARLAGRRFVAISELPRGAPLREGLVKVMTGGEPMPVRHLNKGFFDLVPEFIPFMSGNDLPEVGGLDHGIWRRLKFVHWPVTLDKAEQRPLQEVVAEFMAEASGILNWLLEGAMRFLEHGLQDPQSVTDATESHRADLDPVGAFAAACVRKVGHVAGQMGEVQARAMYLAFVAWCDANAVRPWKETAFGRAMKKKGFEREDKRIRVWVGVELCDVPQAPRSPHGSGPEPEG